MIVAGDLVTFKLDDKIKYLFLGTWKGNTVFVLGVGLVHRDLLMKVSK